MSSPHLPPPAPVSAPEPTQAEVLSNPAVVGAGTASAASAPNTAATDSLDQEVDLLEYLHAILRVKYRIIEIAMGVSLLVFLASFLQDDIYMATAVVGINIDDKPGGVSPKDFRSSDALGMIEHDFIIDSAAANQRDRVIARMKSPRFAELFIRENQLLQYIYHKQWNRVTKTWEEDFSPDMREAIDVFLENILNVYLDEKTGLVMVSIKARDADLSAKLANTYVRRFNEYSRKLILDELNERRKYLEARIKEVNYVELQRSMFRLLETQMAAETLVNARLTFPLEEIHAADPPLIKHKPKRLLTSALTFLGVVFLGITAAIGSVLKRKLTQGLMQHVSKQPAVEVAPSLLMSSIRKQRFPKRQAPSQSTHPGDEWVDRS